MNTHRKNGYTWNWEIMEVYNSEKSIELGMRYKVRWNSNEDILECKQLRPIEDNPQWTEVKGHDSAIKSFQNYIAEKILLEEGEE